MEQDTSLWHQHDNEYVCAPAWWHTFVVYAKDDGRWRWYEVDHDGWDGEQVIDEISRSSEDSFATWQEAAADCEQHID